VAYLVGSFLPLWSTQLDRNRSAQRFRGVRLRGGWRGIADWRTLLAPLFSGAVRRARRLAFAARVRELDAAVERLVPPGGLKAIEVVWVLAAWALAAGIWWAGSPRGG
jgi:energy-coupling factor transporter transmembrane protein EcfT